MNRKPHILLGEDRPTGCPATRGTPEQTLYAVIGDAFGGSSSVTFSGDWLVQNNYDGFDRNIDSTDAAGGMALSTFDPGGRTIAVQVLGSPGGPTPTDRSGSSNVLLASAEARFDEAGRQYEAQRDVFLDGGAYYNGVGTPKQPYRPAARPAPAVVPTLRRTRVCDVKPIWKSMPVKVIDPAQPGTGSPHKGCRYKRNFCNWTYECPPDYVLELEFDPSHLNLTPLQGSCDSEPGWMCCHKEMLEVPEVVYVPKPEAVTAPEPKHIAVIIPSLPSLPSLKPPSPAVGVLLIIVVIVLIPVGA